MMSLEPHDKARRQQALLAVLQKEEIGSQEALRRALKRHGFPVTQATLSRDLKELRIPCVPTPTGYRYEVATRAGEATAPPQAAPRRLQSVAAAEVRGIDSNEVAVVVSTLTGRAQGVAVYIDGLGLEDVLATLAGDDTIMVLPRSIKRTARVRRELARLFGLE
jgi:transcriptional regulator of arginine metabolism